LAGIVLEWRRFVVRVTIVAAVVSVVTSLLLPTWYSSTATILPPSERGSIMNVGDLMGQFTGGAVGATRAAAQRLLGRSPMVDLTIGILKSRRTRGLVVDQFDLVDAYQAKSRTHAIKALGRRLKVGTSPEGLINVTVEDRDGDRAANLANAFLAVLDSFNREISVDDARRTLEFIQVCMDENRGRMKDAAERLLSYQEAHGAIELKEQARVTVEAIAELQAQKTAREIKKRVLEQYATAEQISVRQLENEIREIERSLSVLEGRSPRDETSADSAATDSELPGGLLPLRRIPSLGIEFADLKREVLVQEKVYQLLTAQYEEARIRQARDQTTITVLDEAVPPIRKSRPRRSIIVIISTLLGFALSASLAIVSQSLLDRLEAPGDAGGRLRSSLGPLASVPALLRAWGGPRPD
jgi:uncharacterized protein involved in exopolysaccharide biosynthesis